ncbi:MAG: asparaginase [Alphaproteobacteria bacterium]|nr:asparaginase [Alphaproteobacteria bacterium]
MTKPRIAVLALGGTIAMVKGDAGGVRPGLGADDLVAAVPGIDAIADLQAETISRISSSDLTVPAVLAVARRIEALAAAGAIDGAVVTQGTDTMEESSFLLDLVLTSSIPVVVTGAMRNPLSVSHDGPGNVLAAVRVAADPTVRAHAHSIGVLVVMLDNIHAAVNVAKATSTRIDAFTSPETGPVGILVEDRVRLSSVPNRDYRTALETETDGGPDMTGDIPSVALHTLAMGESGGLLKALIANPDTLGYAGLVLGATGGGHAPEWLVEPLETLAKRVPVVMAGRMQAGYLLAKTYERAGSEIDLINRGIVSAGRLPPLKARLLLTVMLTAGLDAEAQARVWATLN